MDSFQSIESIGRDALLKEINSSNEHQNPNIVRKIGDDAAVILEGDESFTLLSSETYVEGVDFDLTYSPFNHLGYKLLSNAISDIYAMNGKPVAATINLSLPNKLSVQMVKDLYAGFYSAAFKHGAEVVGGDLNGSHSNLVISISVYGKVSEDAITYRTGAQVGDAICVSGDLGGAIAGLRVLMREKKYWEEHNRDAVQPDLSDYEYVVRRQLVSEARKDVVDALAEIEIVPTSMIDITKGLSHELLELTSASKTGAYIYQAALPVAIETRQVADEMEEDADKYAFFGGEDLELLFTLPKEEIEKFGKHFNDFVVIGRIAEESEGIQIQTGEGNIISIDELS